MKFVNCKIIKISFSLTFFCFFILYKKNLTKNYLYNIFNKRKRVGVTCLINCQNVGNILVKYSMFKKLEELGFNATIIVEKNIGNPDISFINRTLKSNLYTIKKDFSELKEKDFDYLIVNSDQTWNYGSYDIALLRFAKNWKIKKFIYGTSMGSDRWLFSGKKEEIAKNLLKNFTGISFREIGTVKLAEQHLGVKGVLVLDPTLIVDKQYYLNEIKNYKDDYNHKEKYIFIYQLDENEIVEKFIKNSSVILNLEINKHQFNRSDFVESFIFGINNCQCVITDSFHGTIFSIIFEKPFISFINKERGKGRFDSLKEIFNLEKRIIDISINNNIDINLLLEKPNINKILLKQLRSFSINYLKKNLEIF